MLLGVMPGRGFQAGGVVLPHYALADLTVLSNDMAQLQQKMTDVNQVVDNAKSAAEDAKQYSLTSRGVSMKAQDSAQNAENEALSAKSGSIEALTIAKTARTSAIAAVSAAEIATTASHSYSDQLKKTEEMANLAAGKAHMASQSLTRIETNLSVVQVAVFSDTTGLEVTAMSANTAKSDVRAIIDWLNDPILGGKIKLDTAHILSKSVNAQLQDYITKNDATNEQLQKSIDELHSLMDYIQSNQ